MADRAKRMHSVRRSYRYVLAMFPPAALVPVGVIQFGSLYFALEALGHIEPIHLTARGIVGATSTVLWMLLVRLQDDLVDVAHDQRLGQAGDPRYRDRPIVTGGITASELRVLYRVTLGVIVGSNAVLGFSYSLFACLGGLGITWLGFRWFFIPSLAANPTPIAYLVRKLLTLLVGVYALAVFVDDFGLASLSVVAIPLLLAPTIGVAAWEVARKIRIPEDETAYQTYSKVLGWRTAALLPAMFVLLSAVCISPVAHAAGLGWTFQIALVVAAGITIAACVRFRLAPNRRYARLAPFAQFYGAVAHGGLMVALILRYGMMFS